MHHLQLYELSQWPEVLLRNVSKNTSVIKTINECMNLLLTIYQVR